MIYTDNPLWLWVTDAACDGQKDSSKTWWAIPDVGGVRVISIIKQSSMSWFSAEALLIREGEVSKVVLSLFLRTRLWREKRGYGSCLQPLRCSAFFGLAQIHTGVESDCSLLPFPGGMPGSHSVIDRKDVWWKMEPFEGALVRRFGSGGVQCTFLLSMRPGSWRKCRIALN